MTAIAVGFVGALLGGWLAGALGLPDLFILDVGGVRLPIIWSIIGSTLFVAIVSFVSRGPRRYD